MPTGPSVVVGAAKAASAQRARGTAPSSVSGPAARFALTPLRQGSFYETNPFTPSSPIQPAGGARLSRSLQTIPGSALRRAGDGGDGARDSTRAPDAGHDAVMGMDMTGNPIPYYTVLFWAVGIQSIALGFLGDLTTKTYLESQEKPIYVVREIVGAPKASLDHEEREPDARIRPKV